MAKMTWSEVQALRRRISSSCRYARTSGSPGVALLEALAESAPWAPGEKQEKKERLERKIKEYMTWCYIDRTEEEMHKYFTEDAE